MKTLLFTILILWGYYHLYFMINPLEYQDEKTLSKHNRYTNGSYVFYNELEDSENFEIEVADSTLYQMLESDSANYESIIWLMPDAYELNYGTDDYFDRTSTERLIEWVDDGGTVLITAEPRQVSFLLEKLGMESSYHWASKYDYKVDYAYNRKLWPEDTSGIPLNNYNLEYIHTFDTRHTKVLLVADTMKPVMTITELGQGKILYCTEKNLFENYVLIRHGGYLLDGVLSYLNTGNTLWMERIYQPENDSMFKHIQKEGSLSWAYYLIVIGSLTFIISHSRRRQRAIPLLEQKRNDTLLFATNISKMYRPGSGYYQLAKKRYAQWLLFIKRKYGVSETLNQKDIEILVNKSGCDRQLIILINNMYRNISIGRNSGTMGRSDFLAINKAIDEFYRKSE